MTKPTRPQTLYEYAHERGLTPEAVIERLGIENAELKERAEALEEAAKVAEDNSDWSGFSEHENIRHTGTVIAAAIRGLKAGDGRMSAEGKAMDVNWILSVEFQSQRGGAMVVPENSIHVRVGDIGERLSGEEMTEMLNAAQQTLTRILQRRKRKAKGLMK